jgi:hypothetical protein
MFLACFVLRVCARLHRGEEVGNFTQASCSGDFLPDLALRVAV